MIPIAHCLRHCISAKLTTYMFRSALKASSLQERTAHLLQKRKEDVAIIKAEIQVLQEAVYNSDPQDEDESTKEKMFRLMKVVAGHLAEIKRLQSDATEKLTICKKTTRWVLKVGI